MNAIFILLSLIQHRLNKKERLYVAFIDMMKCFDTIYRDGLWLKLFQTSIKGRVLRILRNMHQQVKPCVKLRYSFFFFFFHCEIGLRQGKVLSPILFSLFVEDLELFLEKDTNCGLYINDIVCILLLLADDMAVIGRSQQELQQHLNFLHEYCDKWGLKVNRSKTKIVVFRKRGRPTEAENGAMQVKILKLLTILTT